MLQVDIKVPAHKYVFDLKKESKVITLINRKVEELTAINNELQSRDLVYEGYSNRIKMKREELNIKKRGLESKEKEYLNKYLELIENDEIVNSRVKELNKLENILELKLNDQGEASKNLLYNISCLREKINSKLIESEDKQKLIESREKKINEAFENLMQEEKEEYKKLEIEHLEKITPTNYYKPLDDISQLKIKDIMKKIKQSQLRTPASLYSYNENNFPQANEENLLPADIDNKKVNEKMSKENLVGKLRNDFKKKGSFVLEGLNISCLYKCKHSKSKTLNKDKSSSPIIIYDKNKYTTDHKSNEKDSALLNNFKLNKTFYLTQTKRIDIYGSVDLDVDSVCGPHCCNKLGSNRYQYHAATHKSLVSKQNVERTASATGNCKINKTQNNEINVDNEKNKLEENAKVTSSKGLNVTNLEEEKDLPENKTNLNNSITELKDDQTENNHNNDIKLKRNIPITPSVKFSNDNNKNSKHYSSNDVKNIVDTIKSQIYDIFNWSPKRDLKNLKSSLNNSVNHSKILNDSKSSLNNSNKMLANTKANIRSNSRNLNDSKVVSKSNTSLTGTKALNSSNKSLPPSKTLNSSKSLSGSKVMNATPKKPIINTAKKNITEVKKIPMDSAKKVTGAKTIINDSNKKNISGGAKILSKDTKANSVTKKLDVAPKKDLNSSKALVDNKKNVNSSKALSSTKPPTDTKRAVTPIKTVTDTKKTITPSKPAVDAKKTITPSKPAVDAKKTITPSKPAVDAKKTVTPSKPAVDVKKTVTPSKPVVDTKKVVTPNKPAVDAKKAVTPTKPAADTKNAVTPTKPAADAKNQLNSSKTLSNSNKELNTSKTLLGTKKDSSSTKTLVDIKKVENSITPDKSKIPVKPSSPLNDKKVITTLNSNNSKNSLLSKSPTLEEVEPSLLITKNEKFHYFS